MWVLSRGTQESGLKLKDFSQTSSPPLGRWKLEELEFPMQLKKEGWGVQHTLGGARQLAHHKDRRLGVRLVVVTNIQAARRLTYRHEKQ